MRSSKPPNELDQTDLKSIGLVIFVAPIAVVAMLVLGSIGCAELGIVGVSIVATMLGGSGVIAIGG